MRNNQINATRSRWEFIARPRTHGFSHTCNGFGTNNFYRFEIRFSSPREKHPKPRSRYPHVSLRNGDTRRAYYSIFDRASSRRASTRRDASIARTLGKVVGRYDDRPTAIAFAKHFFSCLYLLSSSCSATFTTSLGSSASPRAEIVPRLSSRPTSRVPFPRERRIRRRGDEGGLRVVIDEIIASDKIVSITHW